MVPKHRHVCMITHSFYESDNRVIRYAEALAKRGDLVDVVALRRDPELPHEETIKGVTLHRIQDRFGKTESSKSSYLWPLLRFLVASLRWMIRAHRQTHFDLVHVHNVPDFLVFAAWYSRCRGSRVILDIHDMLPEFFGSKFRTSNRSALVWGLKLAERISAAMAHHIIIANDLWLEKYTARSAPKEKCSVFINYVDEEIFHIQPRKATSAGPIVMFPGGLQWHQGLDIAIRAFGKLKGRLPQAEFHIYGDGDMKPQLVALAQQLGLAESVRFFGLLRLQEIARVMAAADLGVVPKRADSFGNEAYSTKIMEFMAVGVPLVVSSTKIDRYYFDDSVVQFFESGNENALADAMFEVLTNDERRRDLVRQSREYVDRNGWQQHRTRYLQLVDSLITRRPVVMATLDQI